MKQIHISLGTGSIGKAIRELESYQERISRRAERLVSELTEEGRDIAQASFGRSVKVTGVADGEKGAVEASGSAAVIMEFGAGLMTMEEHPLAENAPVPVHEWSYSETVGSGEGYATGQWHFGGRAYQYVIPRHGMLDARDHIVNVAEEKARSVFGR